LLLTLIFFKFQFCHVPPVTDRHCVRYEVFALHNSTIQLQYNIISLHKFDSGGHKTKTYKYINM